MPRPSGPVLSVMALLGSAFLLAGTFWLAHQFTKSDGTTTVGIWADDSSDRLQVVLGDPDADWHDLEISADDPVRFALNGEAADGPVTPRKGDIPITSESEPVWGGQRIELCSVDGARTTEVTIR